MTNAIMALPPWQIATSYHIPRFLCLCVVWTPLVHTFYRNFASFPLFHFLITASSRLEIALPNQNGSGLCASAVSCVHCPCVHVHTQERHVNNTVLFCCIKQKRSTSQAPREEIYLGLHFCFPLTAARAYVIIIFLIFSYLHGTKIDY